MQRTAKIYVAGHRGLVGSAIMRRLAAGGYRDVVTRTHAELDLTNQLAVRQFFATEHPEYVFLAAARVGGIHANNTYPAEFIYQNLMIQANVIQAAHENKVKKLLFLGSSCIYPKHAPQPMKEEYLLTGLLEPTNEPYAIAKIAGIKMCAAYNRQFGTNYISVMPTNLYGPGDNFDAVNSHVVPALIRRMHEAKQRTGTRTPLFGEQVHRGASFCTAMTWRMPAYFLWRNLIIRKLANSSILVWVMTLRFVSWLNWSLKWSVFGGGLCLTHPNRMAPRRSFSTSRV